MDLLNRTSKYFVTSAVASTLLLSRSEEYAWGVVGAAAVAGTAKVLKKLFRSPRPDSAAEADEGMPSSHATCIAYLCTSTVLWLDQQGYNTTYQYILIAASSVLTILRVTQGNHTSPQVVAGVLLGVPFASIWAVLLPPTFYTSLRASGGIKQAAFWVAATVPYSVALFLIMKRKKMKTQKE